jgi:hypothetical protein
MHQAQGEGKHRERQLGQVPPVYARLPLGGFQIETTDQKSVHCVLEPPSRFRQVLQRVAQVRIRGHQLRDEEMSNSIARYGQVEVRGVDDRTQARCQGSVVQLLAGDAEEWPQDPIPTSHDSGEPSQAAAKGEAQEYGLDLVVRVVRGHGEGGTPTAANLLQEAVADAPRGSFHTLPRRSVSLYLTTLDPEGDFQRLAQSRGSPGSAGRVFVETVVQMSRNHFEIQSRGDVIHRPEQGSGIRSSGECDYEPVTRLNTSLRREEGLECA